MKFAAVCSSGLGSSFMVESNIKKVLKELNVDGIEVTHFDLGSVMRDSADVFFGGADLADSIQQKNVGEVVVLQSIIDKAELKEKVTALCKEKNILS